MTARTIIIASPHLRNDSLEVAVREALPDRQVLRLRDRDELSLAALESIDPELIFFPHWSWLIPPEIHSRYECVVFHMTDVPYGRGGSPVQNLIVRGKTDTKISALLCTADLDAGPVYMKRPLSLEGTAEDILRRASGVISSMIVDLVRDRLSPRPQQGEVVVFARRRGKDSDLGSASNLHEVYDHIRMLDGDGYPPAFLETEHLRLEFRQARVTGDELEATVRIRSRTS